MVPCGGPTPSLLGIPDIKQSTWLNLADPCLNPHPLYPDSISANIPYFKHFLIPLMGILSHSISMDNP